MNSTRLAVAGERPVLRDFMGAVSSVRTIRERMGAGTTTRLRTTRCVSQLVAIGRRQVLLEELGHILELLHADAVGQTGVLDVFKALDALLS